MTDSHLGKRHFNLEKFGFFLWFRNRSTATACTAILFLVIIAGEIFYTGENCLRAGAFGIFSGPQNTFKYTKNIFCEMGLSGMT